MVIINQGDDTTCSQLVTLYLSAEDYESGMGKGAQMCFSNDSEQWSTIEPFALTKDWLLSPGEGEKTVYAKLCDVAGNWMSQPITDSIKLEENTICIKPIQLAATALDCSGSFLPLWSKEKAVDGKIDTGWLSPLRLSIQEEYLTLDLGEITIINRMDISSHPFLFLNPFPLDFHIQASTDNVKWAELFSADNYSPSLSYSDSWFFDDTQARYLKVVITKTQPFLFFFYLTYIAEINVHGCLTTEISSSQLILSTTPGQTKHRDVKVTPDATTDEKKPLSTEAPPGPPGKPVFILN